MLSSARRKVLFGVSLAALASLAASAAPITTQVELVNAGLPSIIAPSVTIDGITVQNVYIGPYTLLINGQDVAALCIDFFDESYLNTTWTAYETTVGSSNLVGTYSPADPQEYQEEAYIYSQIILPGADRTGLQEAAWDIMAYGITSNAYTTELGGDNSYIDAALANYSSVNDAAYTIISDTTAHGEQEFLIDDAPEPPSFYLLLGPALLLGLVVLRRQRTGISSIQ